jgi:hypothetical protein
MDKDEKRNIERFKNYVDYAPKIILPVSLRMLQSEKPNSKTLVERTRTLLQPSQPVRCTSAQYCDRNGVPLLYYFGRRLVREDDKKVSNIYICLYTEYDNISCRM